MPRVGCEDNCAKSASARVLRVRMAGSLRGEACAGRTPPDPKTSVASFQGCSRQPGALLSKKSLGQRRGVDRALRWPQKQQRQVRQRARAPWAVGQFSTRRSARGPIGTETERYDHGVPKPQPPTCRNVGEEEPRPTAWVGACPELAAKITAPSPQTRACSVGGRPVLPRGEARAGCAARELNFMARHFEAAAADLARFR